MNRFKNGLRGYHLFVNLFLAISSVNLIICKHKLCFDLFTLREDG